nr:hypothetical protein CFP56_16505 [Quercus suber]POF04894.1 hypothetical protein CFP56_73855 [Quercus suber]
MIRRRNVNITLANVSRHKVFCTLALGCYETSQKRNSNRHRPHDLFFPRSALMVMYAEQQERHVGRDTWTLKRFNVSPASTVFKASPSGSASPHRAGPSLAAMTLFALPPNHDSAAVSSCHILAMIWHAIAIQC